MDYFGCCIAGVLFISFFAWLSSIYAYVINQRYAIDDPARKDYDLGAVFLAPITWPFHLVVGLMVTILKAIFFGVFLLLFSLSVAVIRRPFFWPWIEPILSRIGRMLLKINTALIRLFARNP